MLKSILETNGIDTELLKLDIIEAIEYLQDLLSDPSSISGMDNHTKAKTLIRLDNVIMFNSLLNDKCHESEIQKYRNNRKHRTASLMDTRRIVRSIHLGR